MAVRVLVGGVDLDTIATVADLEDSTVWRSGGYSGDYEASLTWAASSDFAAPWFHAGATVEIVEDGAVVWSGFLGDPQQGDAWGLTAFGWGAEAANYASDSASGTDLEANVDDATSRGMGFSRFTNTLPDTAQGDAVMLDEVLDVAAKVAGQVWWVSLGELSFRAESTGVDWIMSPDSAYLGTTDQEMVTRLVGHYVSAVDGDGNPTAYADAVVEDAAAAEKFRPHERVLDLTPLGLLVSGDATDYTEARFAQVGARAGFTNGFTMTALNSADAATAVPDPMGVRAGHRVRLSGLTDMRTGVTYMGSVEVTLGKVRRRHVEGIAICEPLGLVARDFQGALSAAQPKQGGVMEL